MNDSMPSDMRRYVQRRVRLLQAIEKQYSSGRGSLLLFADGEPSTGLFTQERSFYYMTGIQEPGVALLVTPEHKHVLFVPTFNIDRAQWVHTLVDLATDPSVVGVDQIVPLGKPAHGYALYMPPAQNVCQNLLEHLAEIVARQETLYVVADPTAHGTATMRQLLALCVGWVPGLSQCIVDISSLVHQQRRIKDDAEIACMQRAVDVTIQAQQAAAQYIRPGIFEYQVRAVVDYTFAYNANAVPAFPSIVATGSNTTVLHYTACDQKIAIDDLVVVDIGASSGLYAADITRTYPASGRFSPRQREVYQAVLDTQTFIAQQAKPGMFLRNAQHQDRSLHHMAVQFLASRGLERYFCHGIGHYLGLDVHDVGTYQTPLQAGDVITIEPGVYIRDEGIGVRIEDDYVITEQGAHCLSAALVKDPDQIETWMASLRVE